MQLFKIPEWFVWSSFIATFLATLWKGGGAARVISGTQLGQMLLLRAWWFFTGHSIAGAHHERLWAFVVQDIAIAAIIFACVVRARRYWVLWAAAIWIDCLTTDVLVMLRSGVITIWAYKWASYIWAYSILALTLSDVWANLRDERAAQRPVAAGVPRRSLP